MQKKKERMYKTKLQELCHKNNMALPRYSAMKDGPDHLPSFKASVLINGLSFDSMGPCTCLKEAHNQAAMLAFHHFTENSSMLLHPSLSPSYSQGEMSQSPHLAVLHTVGKEAMNSDMKKTAELQSDPICKEQTPDLALCLTGTGKDNRELELDQAPSPHTSDKVSNEITTSLKSLTLKEELIAESDIYGLSINELVKKQEAPQETTSYLLGNRFRVYTDIPDFTLPEGCTLLPIRENRWAVVSLELPN